MGRILGIDYGTKRIGLAITDECRIIASPLEIIPNDMDLFDTLNRIITTHKVTIIVVGAPIHDKENSFQPQVLGFLRKIKKQFELPLYIQDESLSSKETRSFLIQTGKRGKKLKENLDKYAAQKILSDFLQNFERNKGLLFQDPKSEI